MIVRAGDSGEPVKALQRGLNKLGSLLLVDGQFGSSTQNAVTDAQAALGLTQQLEADDQLQAALAAAPDLFPALTAAGVTFIGLQEVGSAAAYEQVFRDPTWPTAISGITIGIGYDLQFVTPGQFRTDWDDRLPADALDRLAAVAGVVGSRDRLALVDGVSIPLASAVFVFASRSLRRYLDQTRVIYPTVDTLPATRRTALVSLVYNRGPRLEDRDPDRQDRREIRAIRDLLATGAVEQVADQFDSMARLWDPQVPGLVRRRHEEATLWRSGFAAVSVE